MKHVLSLVIALTAIAHGYQWQGAKMVWQTDTTDHPHMDDLMLTSDADGAPWVVWNRWAIGNLGPTMVREISHWDGHGWTEPKRLPETVVQVGSYWDGVFAADGRLWLIYPMSPLGNYCDIQSVRFDPNTGLWDEPVQVNAPDTNSLDDFYPRIDVGGGEVWAVWFNEVDSRAIGDVKASHWDDSSCSWGAEMTANPDTSGINRMEWFPDVAVDGGGMPHVVWTCSRPGVNTPLLYSRYENGQWTTPESLTNPDSLNVSGPYGGTRPRLVDDASGDLHCVFLGARPGDSVVGLYYCRWTDGQWKSPVRTDTWAAVGVPIWDKDLAVASPDDIWVTFDRGGGSDWMVFAQHFDGQSWTPEERIDDDRTFGGGFPKITLDADGLPFVAWSADTSRTRYRSQIWYNRYAVVGQAEDRPTTDNPLPMATVLRRPPPCATVYDAMGRRILEPKPGVYFLRERQGARGEVLGKLRKVIITR